MTRKSRINYLKAISHNVERKKMYKAKKQWVVAGMSFLVATGLGAFGSHLTTHADVNQTSTQAQKQPETNSSASSGSSATKSNIQSASTKLDAVQSHANHMYRGLMLNAANPSNQAKQQQYTKKQQLTSSFNGNNVTNSVKPKTNSEYNQGTNATSASTNNNINNSGSNKSSVESENKSANAKSNVISNSLNKNISSSAPINQRGSFNSAYDSYMAQMSGTDSKVTSMNAADTSSSSNNQGNQNSKVAIPKHNLGDGNDNTQTGTYDGLNYKYDKNAHSLEFTSGKISVSNTFDFLDVSQFGGSDILGNTNLKSVTFDNGIDTSQVTNMRDMFSLDSKLQNLTLPSSFDTSNVTNMSGMFSGDSALQSLDLGNHFDTSKITDMNGMFSGDSALQSLDLGNHFDTSKVTNMRDMFNLDSKLQNLTLPSSFDTSNVTNMSNMFDLDSKLQNLTLPSSFDTSKITDMNGMFYDDPALQSLTIQSQSTKLNSSAQLPNMYKKDSGNSYTSPTSNDFSKGNVGTFIRPKNVPTDTINYQLNGKTVATQAFTATSSDYNGNGYNNLDITSSNDTKIPSGYKLVNPNNSFNYDSGTYNVPITVNSVTTNGTFNYTNQKGSNVNQYTTNRNFSISGTPNQSQNVEQQANNDRPNGYSLASGNPINVDNNQQTQNINVSVVGNNISDKPISITIDKYDNRNYVGSTSATYHTGQGETGNTFTIDPNNYNPSGYKASSSPVNDIFTPNGVQTSNYTFNYNAQQGTPINVNYINQHGQNVGSGHIAGNVDDTGNATQKVNIPNNYNLNNGQNLDYHITTGPQTINLNVTGKSATVKFDFNNQHSQHVGSDTVNAEVGDTVQPNSYPKGYTPNPIPSYTITSTGTATAPTANVKGESASQDNGSGNYKPRNDNNGNDVATNTAKGYATIETVKYSSGQLVSDSFKTYDENNVDVGDTYTIAPPSIVNYTANANQQLTGTVKSDGSLSNGYAKFTYNANPDSNQINVQYKNQDGNIVATGSVGGTYDEKGTISDLPSTNNINNNYTLNSDVNYQINHTQSPLVVGVTGKPANATINFTNQNGKSEGSTTVNGKVGDTVSPNSNQYPQGYQPNPAPNYTFNNAGNNTAITAHVKGQSASALNGSNNYTPKADADDVANNAKHGYATVETVKHSSGQLVSDSYKTFNENNFQVGNSFKLIPQFIPNYTTNNGSVTDTVNSDGSLSNNGFAKFVYNANDDSNPIHVQYINQDGTKIYSDNISGTYDEKGTITNLPSANGTNANYTLNHHIPYQFEADSNPLNVGITGKPATATINFSNQTGDNAGNETVSGKAGDTVSPSQYPSGYMKPNPATTYHFNTAGTNPDMDNVVLHGATASDLNGSKEYNPYTPTSDGSNTDPTTDTNNPLNPNSSKNNNDDKYNADHGYATINVVQYINDKIVKESAHVINENSNHSVGDHYSIDPDSNSLLPYGYKPATTTTSLNGTIQPNGSLSNGYATFKYVVDPSMIKPIQATFYNQDGATINVHTGDDSSTNDTEYISSNNLATLGPVGTSVNIMKFLTAPYGYHFIANEVPNVTLQQKSHGFGMMLLNVLMPSKQDLANMAIRNDSAETSNDLNITQNFLNQSTISGSVKSDINNDIEIINNESADINNDINGGYASEANANNAFDNANLAYGFAYSEYASATSSYASSVASANANNIASGSAHTASTIASKAASGSASTALTKAINEAHDKENKLQQAINDTKAALQKSQNDSSQDNTSNQKEIAALRTKISKLQKTLANTKKRDAKILATAKASAANSSSYANSMANSAENNLEQQLVNTKLELQEDQAKGQSTIQGNQNEITALKTKITKLQRALANTKKHNSNSLASAEAQDTSVASYAISMANSKESNLEKQLTNAEKELHADQSSSQSTIKNNQSEITELNTKIADIQKDLTNTKQQDASNQASEATKDASASSLANSEASSNENSLEQQLSNAESELKVSKSNSQSIMNNTQSEMAQLRTKINDLQQALTNEKAKITNTSTSVSASEAQSSASSALSSSTSQINSDVSLVKDWYSNSAISDTTRKSISNDINTMNTDISEINQYIGKGSNGSISAAKYLASASSAYFAASNLANSAINSYNSSASSSALSSLIANAVSNATKSNRLASTSPVSLTSGDIQDLADEIQPTNNTGTDSSALNNLTREVATNNSEIGSLANKPNSAESINYGYFDNLVNNGVDKLTNAINNDFKANVHHVHVQPAKPRKAISKRAHTYLKWLRIVKPLKLYNNKHQVVRTLRPKHMITLNVKAISKIHNQLVFKVSYRSHSYFIKANSKVVKNAYLPATKRLVGKRVRVLYNVYANRRKASGRIKTLHKNYVGRIKNIVRIGNHNVTRIQLSNNLWISANMNYVKVL